MDYVILTSIMRIQEQKKLNRAAIANHEQRLSMCAAQLKFYARNGS